MNKAAFIEHLKTHMDELVEALDRRSGALRGQNRVVVLAPRNGGPRMYLNPQGDRAYSFSARAYQTPTFTVEQAEEVAAMVRRTGGVPSDHDVVVALDLGELRHQLAEMEALVAELAAA